MHKHHHIGLLTTGQDFLKSANQLNIGQDNSVAPLSVYYLYLHALELSLKSFIYLKIPDQNALKSIGHSLEDAWDQAQKLGIGSVFTESEGLSSCIKLVNPTYQGKELEYFYSGLVELPNIGYLSNTCNNLSTALETHYRAELKST